jgi:hypothetical protein
LRPEVHAARPRGSPAHRRSRLRAPGKPSLDAKVEFYASLGNHDDPTQRFYAPFHMGGQRYYSFKKGNVRFFALDSNYMDPVQLAWLESELKRMGATVEEQTFLDTLPSGPLTVRNLRARFAAARPGARRVVLAAHYDTRPFPDQDPVDRRGQFVGANDGASGTALLCELGNEMAQLKTNVGVDFILFDGEELVFDGNRDPYFLGSEHFAREYVLKPPSYRYRAGVLLAHRQLDPVQPEGSRSIQRPPHQPR